MQRMQCMAVAKTGGRTSHAADAREMSGIEDGSVEEGKRRHDNARNGPRKKQKAPDAFVLDTVGDASLLKSAGCGDSAHCSVAEVHGAQARKQNCGDVVNAKSWPTNKNVQLFTFEVRYSTP